MYTATAILKALCNVYTESYRHSEIAHREVLE